MRAGQLEGRQGVIETGLIPAIGSVAAGTVHSKSALVRIVLGVAGDTVRGCALENTISVAILACYCGMPAGQLKRRQGMIEAGLFPAICVVAVGAALSKSALVGVIFGVAGYADLWCVDQIPSRARLRMAIAAHQYSVLTLQGEGRLVVVEITPEAVDAVMTCQAFFPEYLQMRLHVIGIHPGVTVDAGRQIEIGQALHMAVGAGKAAAIGKLLVRP